MLRSSTWVSLLAILAIGLLVSAPAHACKCMFPPVETALADATAVFEGRVVSIAGTPSGDPPPLGELVVTLRVVRTWKGVESDERIEVRTNGSSAACGYTFAKDQSYLVYARTSEDQKLHVSSCSRTKALADAVEDLTFLGAGSTPVHIESNAADKGMTSDAGARIPSAPVGATAAATSDVPKPGKRKGCSVSPIDADRGGNSAGAWLLAAPALALFARRRRTI